MEKSRLRCILLSSLKIKSQPSRNEQCDKYHECCSLCDQSSFHRNQKEVSGASGMSGSYEQNHCSVPPRGLEEAVPGMSGGTLWEGRRLGNGNHSCSSKS